MIVATSKQELTFSEWLSRLETLIIKDIEIPLEIDNLIAELNKLKNKQSEGKRIRQIN